MISKENSTGTPSFAMPRGKLTASVDIERIGQMSAYQLWALQDSIHTLGDIIAGMLCQPKHFVGDDYSPAGEALENISGWLSTYEQAVVNAAEVLKPANGKDAEWAAWAVLNFEVSCTDDLARLAVSVTNAVRDVQSAKFAEDHRK